MECRWLNAFVTGLKRSFCLQTLKPNQMEIGVCRQDDSLFGEMAPSPE